MSPRPRGSDIFISYSRTNRETAKVFADAFAAQGWTVWWDPEIFYGTQYDKAIEDALGGARCVVVLWSRDAAESRWVRAEASKALERNALVPVRIEAGADVPLEFTKIQTADLFDWEGDRENATFKGLVRGIERVIGSSGATAGEGGPPQAAPRRFATLAPRRRTLVGLGLLAGPTLVALILAVVGMRIHRPTAFDLDLTVTGLTFVSAAERAVQLSEKSTFTRLSLHGIEAGIINAKRAVAADHDTDVATIAPASPPAPIQLPIRFAARDGNGAAAMFSSPDGGGSSIGELDRLFVPAAARVALQMTPEKPSALSARILDTPLRVVLSLRNESIVDLVEATIESAMPRQSEVFDVALRLQSAEGGSLVEMSGTHAGPRLLMSPPAGDAYPTLLPAALRVSAVEFLTQGLTGERLSTVSGAGSIGFGDAPGAAKIDVKQGEYVILDELENFFIRKLALQAEPGAIRVQAGGVAGSLRSGPAGGVRERTLTWLDWVWHLPHSVQLLGLLAWLLPTMLAVYKLVKELRR
jgi:hypothetical protein